MIIVMSENGKKCFSWNTPSNLVNSTDKRIRQNKAMILNTLHPKLHSLDPDSDMTEGMLPEGPM